jgi:prepilin-type N-terminal cleavage/methylation domain-containing protein
MRIRRRRGFSFVELLLAMAIIGLLAGIAIPRYGEMKRRAVASAILGDVHAIRIAAFSYYTEHGSFPPDAGIGQLPVQLVDNLPLGFTFDRPDYDYDWHVWSQTNGAGGTETLVGISVLVTDSRLAAQLVRTAGPGYIPIITPTQVTFLVSSSS